MMLVFSRWMMWALAGALFLGCEQPSGPLSLPAAVGRPTDASQGPRVGVIVARGGEVTVVPSTGKGFPGLPEQQLLRDDKLVTAANSFVVVQLHNGHLVRLGASQSNVVEMLAPFHDPPAGDDVEARFVRLLTPEERDDPKLSGAITRVAGWNTRMNASESFAALPAAEASSAAAPPPIAPRAPSPQEAPGASPARDDAQAESESLPNSISGGRVADAKTAPAKPSPTKNDQPKPRPAPAKIEEAKPSTDDADEVMEANESRSPSPGSDSGSVPPGAPVASAQLPGQLKFTPAKASGGARLVDLPEPFKSGAAALASCAGAGAKITGTVLQGKVIGLRIDGAQRCQDLVGKTTKLEDGTFELTVKP